MAVFRLLAVAAMVSMPMHTAGAASPEPPPGASSCTGCHAAAPGVDSPIPRLAGRAPAETVAQMQAFRSGQQKATVMERISKGFTDDEIQAIAAWYAAQK